MFWYNRTLVEFDLVQHQINFAGSSDVRLSFASPNIISLQTKSDVGLGLIQQVFNVRHFKAVLPSNINTFPCSTEILSFSKG